MKKLLLVGIPALIIILVNFFYGSLISWMLSLTIIASLFFYVLKLGLENIINARLKNLKPGDGKIAGLIAFDTKWKSVLGFSLLSFVFLLSVFTVYFTINPIGSSPWFNNTEYNALNNTGISFQKRLKVIPISVDQQNPDASITFSQQGERQVQITSNSFYQPIFKVSDDNKSILLNNIYDADITTEFSIGNSTNQLEVHIEHHKNNIFKRLFGARPEETIYTLNLHSNDVDFLESLNLPSSFEDIITIRSKPLEKGMSLFNLFLDNNSLASNHPESYQVLENMLLSIGQTYLLSDYRTDNRTYRLFPDKDFIDNAYRLSIGGKNISAQIRNSSSINFDDKFYVGFNNYKQLLHVGLEDLTKYGLKNTESAVLQFDYPNSFMLRSPGKQTLGDRNIRFLTNDFDNVIESNLQEGFYFTTYGLRTPEDINGSLDYFTGKPNSPVQEAVTDNYTGSHRWEIKGGKFSLQSSNSQINYLFEIRDFSKNRFSILHNILYLGISYIAFVLLLSFSGGKRIDRIEPIIFSVILVLVAIRYLMFWRLSTFPPLENITKYELENTLLNFDFKFLIPLPVPLTFILTLLMVVVIIWYRAYISKKGTIEIVRIFKWNLRSVSEINKFYALFILSLLVLYILNRKVLHIEMLIRMVTIVFPLVAYWFFSKLANQKYEYQPMELGEEQNKIMLELKAYFYYLFHNPTFILTILTLGFYAVADRGFAVLFALFVLLKNIFINFLKKPLDKDNNTVKRMLYKPNNFWIFGFTALAVYLTALSFKSLFYYLLLYKFWTISVIIILAGVVVFILYPKNEKLKKISSAFMLLWILLISIPFTRNMLDAQIMDTIKHVQYRASIIHQPIGELMQQNEYTSFKTKKIIETAENQWFINSYISKPFDYHATINLRPHSKVGVDYSTQTRDVVVARYIISEMGNFVMYLILLLILLPLVLYLISYKIHLYVPQGMSRDVGSYAGLIPLVILFTLALFVWLTSTNRFVFFGQDFPFLSLTSRIAVIIPLILYTLTLTQSPSLNHAEKINLKNNAVKYLFFFGVIAAFALSTVRQNELNNKNFTVVMDKTKQQIDVDLNNVLDVVQDSLAEKKVKIKYATLIDALSKDERFEKFKESVEDEYTRSILDNLISKPSSAMQLDNPLFMIYDNGRYHAEYNKNLYLELPPVESRKIWNGMVLEDFADDNQRTASLTLNNKTAGIRLPYFTRLSEGAVRAAFLPDSWIADGEAKGRGLLNFGGNDQVFVYKNAERNIEQFDASFTNTVFKDDLINVLNGNTSFNFSFSNSGNHFALNKWVNGKYRIIYPLKENNFWIYNFTNAVKASYSNDSDLHKNVGITLDYVLSRDVQNLINNSSASALKKTNRYSFSVIAADGNGNIHLMADYVSGRKILDPNDNIALYDLQKQHFFFSNARNERNQWGNRNLLSLYLGVGSSIKPLAASVIASQLNAGWENLVMLPVTRPEYNEYAGFKLVKPWKSDEHYHAEVSLPKYIEVSSNFYQSVMLFLGSYDRLHYYDGKKDYSLKNLLTTKAGTSNSFPQLSMGGQILYLPNYDKKNGNWPLTADGVKKKSFFGNRNSLLSMGFEQNASLNTMGTNGSLSKNSDRQNFATQELIQKFEKESSGGYLWSVPEQSSFLQLDRDYSEIHQNFNVGLKTAALGGYPYRITPYMMLQMYLSMFAQNKNLKLGITPKQISPAQWDVDATWGDKGNYYRFLSNNIFLGMQNVIYGGSGTLTNFGYLKGKYSGLYFYAKTGTINEQDLGTKSSRRLILIASDKDLTKPENIGNTRLYGWYFATDNTGNFDWGMLQSIIDQTIQSSTFKQYFKIER